MILILFLVLVAFGVVVNYLATATHGESYVNGSYSEFYEKLAHSRK